MKMGNEYNNLAHLSSVLDFYYSKILWFEMQIQEILSTLYAFSLVNKLLCFKSLKAYSIIYYNNIEAGVQYY